MRRLTSAGLCILLAATSLPAAAPPTTTPARFAKLPHSASSLGACVADGWLYVYGGHTGRTHTYSTKTATGTFLRVRVSGGDWQELPAGPPMQGMALVAHRGKIYRVGGMQPRNAPGAPADNHSLTSVACYDPATRKWSDLPDLPAGRSSHDAAFVGDRLYVVGGWTMPGKGAPVWCNKVDFIDLKSGKGVWKSAPQPFERRALSAVAYEGKILVLGGLSAKGVSARVDVYDPQANKWSQGVDLPGALGFGFSPAACVAEGSVYVSGNNGKVYRLDEANRLWDPVATQQVARFVHRIVPGEAGRLIVVGGAAHEGNARRVEEVVVAPRKTASR